MRIDVLTIFPGYFDGPLHHGIVRRAIERGLLGVTCHDLRDFARDKHRSVDDTPYAGGGGMVMRPDVWVEAVTAVRAMAPESGETLLLSPQGEPLDQRALERLAALPRLVVLCGRYEAVDERVPEILGCREVSLGDFVLSGGEPAAAAIVDAVARLLPGALGCATSNVEDSFTTGLLDYPHYTKPPEVQGHAVPEVLLSGDHERVRLWRRKAALRATLAKRPDLLHAAALDEEGRRLLEEIRREVVGVRRAPEA